VVPGVREDGWLIKSIKRTYKKEMEGVKNTYKVRAFGITREILGAKEKLVETDGQTVGELRSWLLKNYPTLESLRSLMIAVNNTYAEDDVILTEGDEIGLIPPVSGG
jgi:sulfur-carrier protein